MDIVNLTPHAVHIMDADNNVIRTIEPSKKVARLKTTTVITGCIDDIPITETVFGEVENLPQPKEDTVYIVSALIAQAAINRRDIFIPNESVRDNKGRIIGCRSLGRI